MENVHVTPSAGPDLAVRKIHGVRLEQYAGICAALAGGFPLSDALANDALGERSRAGNEASRALSSTAGGGPALSPACARTSPSAR